MPDYSFCRGVSICGEKKCPVRRTCARYLGVWGRWQSVMALNKSKIKKNGCEYYWNSKTDLVSFTLEDRDVSTDKNIKLKNVQYHKLDDGSYVAMGNVYNNSKFKDAQFIRTSVIKSINANPASINTQNSTYFIDKSELPSKNVELWSLLYGVELPQEEN